MLFIVIYALKLNQSICMTLDSKLYIKTISTPCLDKIQDTVQVFQMWHDFIQNRQKVFELLKYTLTIQKKEQRRT